MSEKTFTIEMIDMDLADLDTDEFLGLTPTYLRSILLELKRCYEEVDRLLETIGSWGYAMCPRSNEWFEWDYGCQSEICASHDDDCRELVEASE